MPAFLPLPYALSSARRVFISPCKSAALTNTLLSLTLLTSFHAQAALPDAVQAALMRAHLSEDNISMIITPVGEAQVSRLPPSVQVIDSAVVSGNVDNNNNKPEIISAPIHKNTTQAPTSVTSQPSNSNSPAANNPTDSTADNTVVIIEKRVITQKERALHAYTDDPYTYQSLESTPNIVPDAPSISDPRATAFSKTSAASTPLISHHPNTARTPASTMKLIPSFIALDMLGADFVWQTRVYHSGLIIGDTLHGDLIIQGSGDPKMTHERLEQLLYRVQQSGIRHIKGDIVLDSSIFSNVTKDPAAFDRAPLRPYNASPDGFLVNFSSISIKSQLTDIHHAKLTYTPQLANYQLPNKINTRAATCGQARYSLAPSWQANRLDLNAALPIDCGTHVFYVAYPEAKDFAARVVAAKWQAIGNTLDGRVITQEKPYERHSKITRQGLAGFPLSPLPIVSYPSKTLAEQIFDINHFSNNVMTEQVALSIGAYAPTTSTKSASSAHGSSLYDLGQPITTDYPKALATINQWWQSHLTTPPPHLTNGSGLCRECTVTAANLSELLSFAYTHPDFEEYVSSLGIAGVSGTISAHSNRLPTSAAIGRAWIKTGTLNNVTAMAGYVKGQSGQDYTVVGIINTDQPLNAYVARPVLDAMLDWSAQQ